MKLDNLDAALERLGEALAAPEDDDLVVDAAIKRFEFTFELTWKAMQTALGFLGLEARSPRETLKAAYKSEWLDDETLWLNMLEDRNLTSHVYDDEMAGRIFENIRAYFPELKKARDVLAKLVNDS